ncbi:uncharacterized protein LOC120128523 [Hibiscus syriacus]|uniref:uncharacterized protein LOC120128523 n=1 Tax=Hibiscus syriacus TaxID=106335 RepID=UPI00192422E4|nr:uncharacterized protein LOC120128523 [Hibiscus syriacus]
MDLRALLARLRLFEHGNLLVKLRVEPELVGEVKRLQGSKNRLRARVEQVLRGKALGFDLRDGDVLYFRGRLYVHTAEPLSSKILHEAHCNLLSVHSGSNEMYQELQLLYFWLGMKRELSDFVAKCLVASTDLDFSVEMGEIDSQLCNGIHMLRQRHDRVWVVVDRLTKSAYFLPVRMDFTIERLAQLYIREIVRLHRVSVSIISDRDL